MGHGMHLKLLKISSQVTQMFALIASLGLTLIEPMPRTNNLLVDLYSSNQHIQGYDIHRHIVMNFFFQSARTISQVHETNWSPDMALNFVSLSLYTIMKQTNGEWSVSGSLNPNMSKFGQLTQMVTRLCIQVGHFDGFCT